MKSDDWGWVGGIGNRGMGGVGNRGMGGVGNRSMGDDGSRCSDDRCGLDDRGGVGKWSCGHERALDGHFVRVGVAGGDREGVGDRHRGSDDRGRVEGSGGRQVAGFRRGGGAGQQSEECDELVHVDRCERISSVLRS